MMLLMVCFLLAGTTTRASDQAISDYSCSPVSGQLQYSHGICKDPDGGATPALPESSLLLLYSRASNQPVLNDAARATGDSPVRPKDSNKKTIVYFFSGEGCPHCKEEKLFLDGLKRTHTSLEIREYEVWHNRENAGLMARMLRAYGAPSSGVPVTIVAGRVLYGFTARTRAIIGATIEECGTVSCNDPAERMNIIVHSGHVPPASPAPAGPDTSITIPAIGTFDARNFSLPLLTLIIAGMDSFNPCAFFVLLSLLGLLTHARSRNKMFLIGGTFVFFSGFIYFLFMAAWLNLFLVMGHMALITTIAGCVSVVIAAINIKDFFLFKQGLSLSIPDSAKPELFDRMRRLLRSGSFVSIMAGTTVLAVVANFYELLCTAGFPMIFTRILTLNNLSIVAYYLNLILYNAIYVTPLVVIVLAFTLTLGKRQLSEWQGRVLKLVSGAMMLELGAVLLINPALLNSLAVSFAILVSALVVSVLVAKVTRRWERY